MTANDPRHAADLSVAGEARKAAMLEHLQRRLAARARVRRGLRLACGVLPVLALLGVLLAARGGSSPEPAHPSPAAPLTRAAPLQSPAATHSEPSPRRPIVVQVATRSGLADALAASPGPSRVRIVSDDELIALAAAEGRPLGIIRAGGAVMVVEHRAHEQPPGPAGDTPGVTPFSDLPLN